MKKEKRDKRGMGHIGLMGPMGPMGPMGLMRPMRPMGLMGPMGLIRLIALIGLMALMGCSSGGDAPETPPTPPTETTDPADPTTPTTPAGTAEIPVVVCMSAASFEDGAEEQYAARRAWTPPTGYHLYSSLYEDENYVNLPNMEQSTIDLFMTHDNETGDAQLTENPLHARLSYSSSTEKWKLVLPNGVKEEDLTNESKGQGNYYAYGFVPRDAADGAIIAKLPKVHEEDPERTWAEGAILTIQGLKSVAVDPCVIIGANDGQDENNDGPSRGVGGSAGLQAGDFKFYLSTTVEAPAKVPKNYLYFLFDHLYSAFSISMRVHPTYHALRHIRLKTILLQTETKSGAKPSKMNVTIRVEKNDNGSIPIVGDIVYATVDDTPTKREIYSDTEGYELKPDYSMFLGHFMPYNVSKIILTSVYDVYDTNTTPEHPNGNLVRKDCKATNTLSMSQLFSGQTVSHRGWKYKVRLTINPTYLYMMSDPDLDNPTVVVE